MMRTLRTFFSLALLFALALTARSASTCSAATRSTATHSAATRSAYVCSRPSAGEPLASPRWVGTWAAAEEYAGDADQPRTALSGNTLRQVIRTSIGGETIRLKLSGTFSDGPTVIKSVYIALAAEDPAPRLSTSASSSAPSPRLSTPAPSAAPSPRLSTPASSAAIVPSSARYLTFNGKRSVTIPAGKKVISDAIAFPLPPLTRIVVTITYAAAPRHLTAHRGSRTTSFIYRGTVTPRQLASSRASHHRFPALLECVDHWYTIASLDVLRHDNVSAIAILGNSITDGRGSTTNAQNRWPDFLATALASPAAPAALASPASPAASATPATPAPPAASASPAPFPAPASPLAVLNLGIGGNCVLHGGISEPARQRFSRDILSQSGVSTLILFEGTNDIGLCPDSLTPALADSLIAAYRDLAARAHTAGLRVIAATITPTKGNAWFSFFHEAARQTINAWIRASAPICPRPSTGEHTPAAPATPVPPVAPAPPATPAPPAPSPSPVFDAVLDFDALVRDPADPQRLRPDYSDDWLHLNPAGYEAMGRYAAEIILTLPTCR